MDYEDSTTCVFSLNALDYQDRQTIRYQEKERDKFVKAVSGKGKILDLGCGPGKDALFFQESGHDVLAIDGAIGMVELARNKGVKETRVMKYSELNQLTEKFDGVWASYSLLHIPKNELANILSKVRDLLNQGGVFYASFRGGEGEEMRLSDRYSGGRYFAYYNEDELKTIFLKVFKNVTIGHIKNADEKSGIYTWIVI